jgi:single-stranded DNA-specific DHH superfamily exonuclease
VTLKSISERLGEIIESAKRAEDPKALYDLLTEDVAKVRVAIDAELANQEKK